MGIKIKDFDELENEFNEISIRLSHIESLSRILLDCIVNCEDFKPCDIENLTSVLKEKVINLKEKFNLIENELGI